jgi:hypothetical protein
MRLSERAYRTVSHGSEIWWLDTDDEYAAEYLKPGTQGSFAVTIAHHQMIDLSVGVDDDECGTKVKISAPRREQVLKVMRIFDENAKDATRPEPPKEPPKPPRVVIGHGRAEDWKTLLIDLKAHGIEANAFETGARAGHTIRDILESELKATDLALLS